MDTLDVGLSVDWGRDDDLWKRLRVLKMDAEAHNGELWGFSVQLVRPEQRDTQQEQQWVASGKQQAPEVDELVYVYPTGRRMYKYHLRRGCDQVFISTSEPSDKTPNVLVSFGAYSLWTLGARNALASVIRFIHRLPAGATGGYDRKVNWHKLSRVDLAADFQLNVPLIEAFIEAHLVSRGSKRFKAADGDHLQSFYVGAKAASVQLRIYDKVAEMLARPGKEWFFDIWKPNQDWPVWRVEYQMRRAHLKRYGINTVDDLENRGGSLWRELTASVASLRLDDDSNTTRRTPHLWWQAVQACATQIGRDVSLEREIERKQLGDVSWYISHVAECLASYAAILGHSDLGTAAADLAEQVIAHWEDRDWREAFRKRSLLAGGSGEIGEDCDVPF